MSKTPLRLLLLCVAGCGLFDDDAADAGSVGDSSSDGTTGPMVTCPAPFTMAVTEEIARAPGAEERHQLTFHSSGALRAVSGTACSVDPANPGFADGVACENFYSCSGCALVLGMAEGGRHYIEGGAYAGEPAGVGSCLSFEGAWYLCEPQCGGRDCGDDGCGGSCGSCAAGESCSGGTCRTGSGSACDDCLSTCSGLPSCCCGSGCICEGSCTPACGDF